MRYVSTRGAAPVLEFGDVLLAGLARDGGLYVPESWPKLAPDALLRASKASYSDVAIEVMWPFLEGTIGADEFATMVTESYATFDDPDVVPLRDLGDGLWMAELFHGPTLAFKDVALQLVGRLFDYELARRGERVTIVGATSGDTGSAAIDACRDRDAIEIVILHPAGRVSDVQRRQMTTVDAPNVHNIAIEGTFDDCQDLVKALFADEPFRDRVNLSAVNSINWARVMAQIVYFVTSSARLTMGAMPVSFAVPTGNFGNVFAGYGAQQMGVPISQFVVASNANDILIRFLSSAIMEMRDVTPTLSPSMDIGVSSNFERLLFELLGRDGATIAELMMRVRAEGSFSIDPAVVDALGEQWSGASFDDQATSEVIRDVYERLGLLLDPHSAVGLGAAMACRLDPAVPMVTLATADPAKFPDAVESATGVRPPLPDRLADLFDRPEHYITMANDYDLVRAAVDAAIA